MAMSKACNMPVDGNAILHGRAIFQLTAVHGWPRALTKPGAAPGKLGTTLSKQSTIRRCKLAVENRPLATPDVRIEVPDVTYRTRA